MSKPDLQTRSVQQLVIRAADLPLGQIADPVAMAVITGVEGPSYRPVGATLLLGRDGRVAGNLSSGCIDADVILHAQSVAASQQGERLRYGAGSPFIDLQLPCGGGLDILVMPVRDLAPLQTLAANLHARTPGEIGLDIDGPIAAEPEADLRLRVEPDLRFAVFGKGPEAEAFAAMTAGAGYGTVLHTPDGDLSGQHATFQTEKIDRRALAALREADPHTAVVLFFHDHDLEPEILQAALAGPAFYIGAQGSRRAAATRRARLISLGLSEETCQRLRGPIGLIPSTRDPRTLAVSVLAEILAESVGRSGDCGL